jgi:hypothetical protein
MTIALSGSQAAASGVSVDTGLACLFRLGVQNGVYAEVGAVKRRNIIEGERVTVARLIALAGEFGLSARRAHFDWQGLTTAAFGHPILLLLDDGMS